MAKKNSRRNNDHRNIDDEGINDRNRAIARTSETEETSNFTTTLLNTAEDAAKAAVQAWIRSVFEEAFCQAMKQVWEISSSDAKNDDDDQNDEETNKNDDSLRISVKISKMADMETCLKYVERIADAWKTSLSDDEGHDNVTEWVDEVFQNGKDTFWMTEAPTEELQEEDGSTIHNHSTGRKDDGEIAHADINNAPTDDNSPEVPTDNINHLTNKPNNSSEINYDDMILYCELRKLGRRVDIDEKPIPIQQAIDHIKMLSNNDVTDWPADPSVIDDTIRTTQTRLKQFEGRRLGGLSTSGTIPKKKRTRFNIPDDDGNDNNESVTFDRRRVRPAAQQQPGTTDSSVDNNISRPPYDLPNHIHFKDLFSTSSLSVHDKKVLDEMVPSDASTTDESSDPSLCLYGQLKPVGKINQIIIEQKKNSDSLESSGSAGAAAASSAEAPSSDGNSTTDENLNDDRTNHVVVNTACRQERLDPYRIQGRDGSGDGDVPKRFKSMILKTEDRTQTEHKYFHIDMGWSLLEIPTTTTTTTTTTTDGENGNDGVTSNKKRKRLYAFSSLEMTLDDKDADGKD